MGRTREEDPRLSFLTLGETIEVVEKCEMAWAFDDNEDASSIQFALFKRIVEEVAAGRNVQYCAIEALKTLEFNFKRY